MFAPLNAMFDKQFDVITWFKKRIPSTRARLTIAQASDLSKMPDADYKKRFNMLANMESDIKNGNVKSMKDLEKKY